jgi:hypothetical protein
MSILKAIVTYMTTSGTHWDNVNGAGIEGTAALSAWNNYINELKVCLEITNLIICSFTNLPFHPVKRGHDPLLDKGLAVFDKFQDILLNAFAKGSNAFSAFHMAPHTPLNQTLDLDVLDKATKGTASGVDTIANTMDVDKVGDTTAFASVSAGKHKFSIITPDENEANIQPIASLKLTTSSMMSLEPTRKKITNPSASITSASRSIPKTSQGSSSTAPSSRLS